MTFAMDFLGDKEFFTNRLGDPRAEPGACLDWIRRCELLFWSVANHHLAWHVQGQVRQWWVYYWNLCLRYWREYPQLYPRFPWIRRFDTAGDLGIEDGGKYLERGLQMIRNKTLVTPSCIEAYGFHLEEIGNLAFFFHTAHRRYVGDLPDVEELKGKEKWLDAEYIYLRVFRDAQRNAIENEIQKRRTGNSFMKGTITPEDLCTYGVLQFIDIRMAELIDDLRASPAIKAKAIWGDSASQVPRRPIGARHRNKKRFSARDLRTTRNMARLFLGEVTQQFSGIRVAAGAYLLDLWRAGGDDRFAISAARAKSLYESFKCWGIGPDGSELRFPPDITELEEEFPFY